MTTLNYKGEPLDIKRFRALVLERANERIGNYDPSAPMGTETIRRTLGLARPVKVLAQDPRYKSYEGVIRAAGFTTPNESLHQSTSEAAIKRRLDEYMGRRRTIRPSAIFKKNKFLYTALQRFGQKAVKSGLISRRDIENVLEYFGYEAEGKWTPKKINKMLRAYWPLEEVRRAAKGNTTLARISGLETLNHRLYYVMKRRSIIKVINSLYKNFPDLYSLVSKRRTVSPANPERIRKQLEQRFYAGRLISSGLRSSPLREERVLHANVLSLGPVLFTQQSLIDEPATYLEIAQELTGLHEYDINGNAPGVAKRNGTVGNLLVEFLLKWASAIDPSGDILGHKFRSVFTNVYDVYAEKNVIDEDSEVIRPDLFVLGNVSTGVEVKQGENLRGPLSLLDKYSDSQTYTWDFEGANFTLERLVAVLHMPNKIVREVDTELADAGYLVVNSRHISTWLERLLTIIVATPELMEQFEEAAPRLHNPLSILGFYDDFANRPASMTRRSRKEEVVHVRDSLQNLVNHSLEAIA